MILDGALTAMPWFSVFVLPVLIFLSRVIDVSIGTVRVIFVARGMKLLAPLLGFFEVLIWLVAIGQIMRNLTEWYYYVAYAGGFATGTFVGIWIESKLAIGVVILRIITREGAEELIQALRERSFGVTSVDATGSRGAVKILFMLVTRQDLKRAIAFIKHYNPHAFYSVEDVRFVQEGIFPPKKLPIHRRFNLTVRKGAQKKK